MVKLAQKQSVRVAAEEEMQMKTLYGEQKIWMEDEAGKIIGEIDFVQGEDGVYDIIHTGVDPSQQGKGTAGKLVQAAAEHIRRTGHGITATCSYASRWLENHQEYGDIYVRRRNSEK